MYEQTSDFKSEKNKVENSPIYLYTIHEYDGVNNLYFAEWDSNVVYDGVTYVRFPIKHDEIAENAKGEIDSLKVTVANVDRQIEALLQTYDIRGKKVTITLVWAAKLAVTDAHIDFVYYVDSYSANQDAVEFSLSSKYDVLDIQLPSGVFYRNTCRWKFKGTQCGYSGIETECNKTKQRCKDLSNIARYGGFPSIPSKRIFT